MTTLIVRPPWASHASWVGALVSDESITSVRDVTQAPSVALQAWAAPSELPPADQLVLVVPGPMLSWHRVDLPKLPKSQWRQALEALLEDEVLCEPVNLHLALEPGSSAGQTVTVAACDKAWLQDALTALEAAGRMPTRLVPEFEPGAPALYLLGQPEQGWLIRMGEASVQCLPLAYPAQDTLQAWQALDGKAAPTLVAEPPLVNLAERVWQQAPQVMAAGSHMLATARSDWNLAQFDLATRSGRGLITGLRRRWMAWLTAPQWRPVRWGLVALVALQVLGLNAWAWKARADLQAQQAEMKAILTRTFPHVTLVIDPLLQMERETAMLAQGSGQATPQDLVFMLSQLSALGAPSPTGLEFKTGELSLVGWQPGKEQLAVLQASLAQQGYRLQAQGERWVLRAAGAGAAP